MVDVQTEGNCEENIYSFLLLCWTTLKYISQYMKFLFKSIKHNYFDPLANFPTKVGFGYTFLWRGGMSRRM